MKTRREVDGPATHARYAFFRRCHRRAAPLLLLLVYPARLEGVVRCSRVASTFVLRTVQLVVRSAAKSRARKSERNRDLPQMASLVSAVVSVNRRYSSDVAGVWLGREGDRSEKNIQEARVGRVECEEEVVGEVVTKKLEKNDDTRRSFAIYIFAVHRQDVYPSRRRRG